jgi:catechol 2,3-dioxygenase-like lactoylglutathione lyase family enzyme
VTLSFGTTASDHSTTVQQSMHQAYAQLLVCLRAQVVSCKPGSTEAHQLLFNVAYNYVELCHIHGTEKQADFHYDSGNNEPKRGFGHLAYLTPDVYAACAKLEELGATFKKKPGT